MQFSVKLKVLSRFNLFVYDSEEGHVKPCRLEPDTVKMIGDCHPLYYRGLFFPLAQSSALIMHCICSST